MLAIGGRTNEFFFAATSLEYIPYRHLQFEIQRRHQLMGLFFVCESFRGLGSGKPYHPHEHRKNHLEIEKFYLLSINHLEKKLLHLSL